jgi:hypothetical protein
VVFAQTKGNVGLETVIELKPTRLAARQNALARAAKEERHSHPLCPFFVSFFST